jgi:hypothetical protein
MKFQFCKLQCLYRECYVLKLHGHIDKDIHTAVKIDYKTTYSFKKEKYDTNNICLT